jgi:small-conductance mechanosensitive channel
VVHRLALPGAWVIGLWIGVRVLQSQSIGSDFVRIAASLLQAWILIRLFSTFVRNPIWAHTFAAVAWVIAALNIIRLLNPAIAVLDSLAVELGDTRLSLLMVMKGAAMLAVLLWGAALTTRFTQSRLTRSKNMTPSVKTLIGQAVRIGSFFFAVMFAMNIIGVDLTAFAVFSGAIGVGIGFGLQAIFSNLVAGIIMLIEQSVKVGDFVELESGLMGEVKEINIRATLVRTGLNVDILVPNSEFINSRVTNWTLRDAFVRIKIPFGVAYGTDKELVKKAALEAADTVPHMLTGPDASPPQVWLAGFGESSLDFELVLMLKPEAVKRPGAVRADYNWALETALSKYGIEIPFPQRDLHVRSGTPPVNLMVKNATSEGA